MGDEACPRRSHRNRNVSCLFWQFCPAGNTLDKTWPREDAINNRDSGIDLLWDLQSVGNVLLLGLSPWSTFGEAMRLEEIPQLFSVEMLCTLQLVGCDGRSSAPQWHCSAALMAPTPPLTASLLPATASRTNEHSWCVDDWLGKSNKGKMFYPAV